MKNINIPLEDEEYDILSTIKKELTWREFLLSLIKPRHKKKGEYNGETK